MKISSRHLHSLTVIARRLIFWEKVHPECDKYLLKTEYKYRILFGFQTSLNAKYGILFGIVKIRIPNTNRSIWSNYLNTKKLIPKKKYSKLKTKLKICLNKTNKLVLKKIHFVLKMYETIRTGIQTDYLNTGIPFGIQTKPNTEYWSNCFNSFQIPNYSSHPGFTYPTCPMSCDTCHVSPDTCHTSHFTCHLYVYIYFFFWSKGWSLSVESLFSLGPIPSRFFKKGMIWRWQA